WGTRRNQVTGQERHVSAHIRDKLRDRKYHRSRIGVLHALSVHLKPKIKALRICNLVGTHQPWTDRAKRIASLPLVPLRRLHLKGSFSNVVDDAISSHVVQRIPL